MEFVCKTSVMKDMIAKAKKGASNNKMIPLTGFIHISLNSNVLKMTTTDSINYLTIIEDKVEGENFDVVVKADLFSSIVSKTSSENIKLKFDGASLTFTGNGTYKIDLPLDENGEPITYPNFRVDFGDNCRKGTIKTSVIKNVILSNKPSLAVTMDAPHLTGYYCTDDCVISADSFSICINKVPTFNETVLVSPTVFELLNMCSCDDIEFSITGDKILFKTPKLELYGTLMPDVDDYPVEPIRNYETFEFPSNCVLPKTALINVIDRLSLFIGDNDINGIYLTFTTDGVKIECDKSKAIETIPYQGSENFKPFTCFAEVDALKKQISARTGEVVHFYYGFDKAIKILDGNVTQIVALLEDTRVKEQ